MDVEPEDTQPMPPPASTDKELDEAMKELAKKDPDAMLKDLEDMNGGK